MPTARTAVTDSRSRTPRNTASENGAPSRRRTGGSCPPSRWSGLTGDVYHGPGADSREAQSCAARASGIRDGRSTRESLADVSGRRTGLRPVREQRHDSRRHLPAAPTASTAFGRYRSATSRAKASRAVPARRRWRSPPSARAACPRRLARARTRPGARAPAPGRARPPGRRRLQLGVTGVAGRGAPAAPLRPSCRSARPYRAVPSAARRGCPHHPDVRKNPPAIGSSKRSRIASPSVSSRVEPIDIAGRLEEREQPESEQRVIVEERRARGRTPARHERSSRPSPSSMRVPHELRRAYRRLDVRGHSSARPATASARIASPFQPAITLSSTAGGTRAARAPNSVARAPSTAVRERTLLDRRVARRSRQRLGHPQHVRALPIAARVWRRTPRRRARRRAAVSDLPIPDEELRPRRPRCLRPGRWRSRPRAAASPAGGSRRCGSRPRGSGLRA